MALGFLSDLGGAVGSLAPVAKSFGGLLDAIRGGSAQSSLYKQAGKMSPAESQAFSLYGALSQPDNTLVKSLTENEMRANTEALLSQLRAMQLTDRRGMLRGRRSTFFNPERADETVDYLVSRGAPALRQQSEQTARTNIMNQANGLRGIAPIQQARQNTQLEMGRNSAASNILGGGYAGQVGNFTSGIQGLLKALQGAF